MKWISLKDKLPPNSDHYDIPFVLAYHTVFGCGVAWFYTAEDGQKEMLEEDYGSKYIISCHFIKNKYDGNHSIDDEDFIDIFEDSPRFLNLGTVTHWCEFPEQPKD